MDHKPTEATAQRMIYLLDGRPWCDTASDEPTILEDGSATFAFTDKWGRTFDVRVSRRPEGATP